MKLVATQWPATRNSKKKFEFLIENLWVESQDSSDPLLKFLIPINWGNR